MDREDHTKNARQPKVVDYDRTAVLVSDSFQIDQWGRADFYLSKRWANGMKSEGAARLAITAVDKAMYIQPCMAMEYPVGKEDSSDHR